MKRIQMEFKEKAVPYVLKTVWQVIAVITNLLMRVFHIQFDLPIRVDTNTSVFSCGVSLISNKQIATRLHLSVDTVKSHVHNILEKLALHTRLEIASYHHLKGRAPSTSDDDPSSEE